MTGAQQPQHLGALGTMGSEGAYHRHEQPAHHSEPECRNGEARHDHNQPRGWLPIRHVKTGDDLARSVRAGGEHEGQPRNAQES